MVLGQKMYTSAGAEELAFLCKAGGSRSGEKVEERDADGWNRLFSEHLLVRQPCKELFKSQTLEASSSVTFVSGLPF